MNVTLRIDDELGKAARHQALSTGVSLSKWMMALIKKELDTQPPSDKFVSLADAMYYPALDKYERENAIDYEFERVELEMREIEL